ncbi:MAG TPA: glycosyltransferase family A protein [Polyangiaceae bacterium]|nr:glycosyltransferase family A protein [Polyangiaceae bacterium]
MSRGVSVVIPMYNVAAWIEETLETVRTQTFPGSAVEIVLVDDASTDESVAKARAFLERHELDGRVVEQERNQGASAARNAGWRLAKYEWIQFLDGDDLLLPRKLETHMAAAAGATSDVAVLHGRWQRYGPNEGMWHRYGPTHAARIVGDSVVAILSDHDFGYVGPTLIRRAFLDRVGGFDEQLDLGEDFDLMLRIAMAGGTFREVPSDGPLFLYRSTPGSLGRRAGEELPSILRLREISRRAERFLRDRGGLGREARLAVAGRYTRCLEFFFEHDRKSFAETLGWLRELGLTTPPGMRPGMQLVSSVVGLENALGIRGSFRRAKAWITTRLRRVA